MEILLIDIDSKTPNLALKKVEKYHLDRGDRVIWDNELMAYSSDKIYVSCVFSWNRERAEYWEQFDNAVIGGSGYSLSITLPPEIERVKPRINLGFTSRGCVRNCKFCLVPKKEGKIRADGDIYDIWDGKSRDVILLDNNILALPKHFSKICSQVKKEKIRVDFNQGLDCRLLTEDMVKELKSLSHIEYRFAFDEMDVEPQVKRAIHLLTKYGINRCSWYVLVGYNTTLNEDLYRLNMLRELNQNAYVQRYNRSKDKRYIPLARWANQRHIFHGMTWEQFIDRPEHKRYREQLIFL